MRYLSSRLKQIKSVPKGQAVAEFVQVFLPLVLLLGLIEFGWLFHAQITVISAAREGARAAAAGEDCFSAVQNHLEATPVVLVEVNARPGGGAANRWYVIEVVGQIKPLVGLFIKGNTIHISAQAAMGAGAREREKAHKGMARCSVQHRQPMEIYGTGFKGRAKVEGACQLLYREGYLCV